MREKLSEMLEKAIRYADTRYPKGRPMEGAYTQLMADHLLAAGVIVPPCKVGDTVYVVDVCATNIIERQVTGIRQNEWGTIYILSFGFGYPDALIGETVFLTRKEAEKALAERSKSDG